MASREWPDEFTTNHTSPTLGQEWLWLPVEWTWWVVIQLILSIVGIVGNLLVMAVIFRRGRSQFATDVLIASLAFADFCTSLWMIPRPHAVVLPRTWVGRLYCRLEYSNIFMWISAVASVFTLSVISVERFLAVAYPFRFKHWFTARRSLSIVAFNWLLSALLNSFVIVISEHDINTNSCVTLFLSRVANASSGAILFLCKYVIPITIMIGSHYGITKELRAQTLSFQVDGEVPAPVLKIIKTMHDMTRTVFIVVVLFIVCWSPDQICFFLFNLGLYPAYLYSDVYRVFVCLAFINSCCNPFIYSARNRKFRRALRELCGHQRNFSGKILSPIFGAAKSSVLRKMGK
ncbi:galanin receptor 2a-like [Diadema antillarum]|uniref:galanin receptor 2a-like n=1 Tax=Diadema antillarum TaxID=105358 RepID=UPI003A87EC1B